MKALITPYVLLIFVASSFATTDTAIINLSTTYAPYMKFSGTAPGSSRSYGNSDIANWVFPNSFDLGTLGLESKISGDCDINFSTQNNFSLLHTISSSNLTKYKVIYQSQEFSGTSNPTLTTPCTTLPTTMKFAPTQLVLGNSSPTALIESGVYQDVVNITVATQ